MSTLQRTIRALTEKTDRIPDTARALLSFLVMLRKRSSTEFFSSMDQDVATSPEENIQTLKEASLVQLRRGADTKEI